LAERTLLDRLKEATGQGLTGIPRAELLAYMADAAAGIDFLNGVAPPGADQEPLPEQFRLAGARFRPPRRKPSDGEPAPMQHRDIKPQNLLLVRGRVKVGDFGLARVLLHSQTSHSGGMTPAYAAPEFFFSETTENSDQYSLAVTYCHLRGGRLPFTGDP